MAGKAKGRTTTTTRTSTGRPLGAAPKQTRRTGRLAPLEEPAVAGETAAPRVGPSASVASAAPFAAPACASLEPAPELVQPAPAAAPAPTVSAPAPGPQGEVLRFDPSRWSREDEWVAVAWEGPGLFAHAEAGVFAPGVTTRLRAALAAKLAGEAGFRVGLRRAG
jgi:hypothetical protein